MEMTLNTTDLPSRIQITGYYSTNCAAGKNITIETAPSGEEILNIVVPEGKTYEFKVWVDIISSDA